MKRCSECKGVFHKGVQVYSQVATTIDRSPWRCARCKAGTIQRYEVAASVDDYCEDPSGLWCKAEDVTVLEADVKVFGETVYAAYEEKRENDLKTIQRLRIKYEELEIASQVKFARCPIDEQDEYIRTLEAERDALVKHLPDIKQTITAVRSKINEWTGMIDTEFLNVVERVEQWLVEVTSDET